MVDGSLGAKSCKDFAVQAAPGKPVLLGETLGVAERVKAGVEGVEEVVGHLAGVAHADANGGLLRVVLEHELFHLGSVEAAITVGVGNGESGVEILQSSGDVLGSVSLVVDSHLLIGQGLEEV